MQRRGHLISPQNPCPIKDPATLVPNTAQGKRASKPCPRTPSTPDPIQGWIWGRWTHSAHHWLCHIQGFQLFLPWHSLILPNNNTWHRITIYFDGDFLSFLNLLPPPLPKNKHSLMLILGSGEVETSPESSKLT